MDNDPLIDLRLLFSIGIPAVVAVIGWFLVHLLNAQRDVRIKRREIQLKGLETAFLRIAMSSNRDWTDERKLEFEEFIAEIQLYGTARQIQLTIEIVQAFTRGDKQVSFDALLEDLRNSLRTELRMEPVKGSVWWYRFKLPDWKKTESSSTAASKPLGDPPKSD